MTSRIVQVSLPRELEAEIAAAVARGEFASESDAIREAVAEWRAKRMIEGSGAEELRRLWRDGLESGPGRSLTIEDIKAEARRRFAQT